ncbi:MAG: SAV_2336 N-terminal domain-related protein, partial [Nostocales cyanobacterium 94392]|nr:SAV_2336 N-terminal domain-related protein [Nostocales cyanobacterium 94392]
GQMIDQLIAALSKEVEMSAEEIADTIWLALQMQEFQTESVSSSSSHLTEEKREIKDSKSFLHQGKVSEEETANKSLEEQKAGIYLGTQKNTSKSSNLSFKVPDAPSLREPLTLARALKPLMRRIPSGRELVLDEAATIQQIADEKLWTPILKPTLEPWLDLELVVDEAISMQIWRHTIRELERLLKNYGIFRDVRVWGLLTNENEQVQIRRGLGATAKNETNRSPKELIDPSGRRLILVVSDCVSSSWRNGKVTPVLELWAKQGSMAIVQMLPKWLWKRTALGRASEVRLLGLTPGVANQKLIAKEVSLWDELDEQSGVKVPVFTLEEVMVVPWAQMLSGKGSIWTLGYVFKLNATSVKKETGLFNLARGDLSAEQRVQAFRVTASPMARKLAGLLASAPVISLPIVRLIREALLKDSQQVHVAEVFLGGLLKPLSQINADTNPDYVQYEFMDGVRELLIDSVPSKYVLNVVDEVSKYVAKKAGLSLENFAAVLRNPQQIRDSEIADNIAYFATVTAEVLRSLGGEYARIAEDLEVNYFKFHKNYSPGTSLINETFNHGYALLIGVGESAYSKLSLPVTVKDTQAIYAALIDPELCAYPDDKEHIRVLNNQEATQAAILKGLNWLKEKAESDPKATIFIYYSGHGWVDKDTQKYYLLQHDIKPTKLAKSALSAETFTSELRQIEAEQLLVVIDSCHAAGMATSKEADLELEEEFDDFIREAPSKGFIDELKKGKGRIVFTSSEGKQKSYIKDDSCSIYTYHFLEALQGAGNKPGDTDVQVSNIMNHLGKAVSETARQLCNVEQNPQFDMTGGDFIIAKLRGGKGLPSKGWDEVKPEATQKINKIADVINQHGKFMTNINEARGIHIGDVYHK